MKLKDMPKIELEVLSYTDLTYMILKEHGKTMNTPSIFRIICDLLEYSEEDYENKIGDYYTSLALDKRFVLLDNAEWDLREKRSIDLSYDEEEELDEEETEEEELDEEETEDSISDEDLDEGELDGLNIETDEELEEEM